GLMDHATQWRNILRGTAALVPRNGDFEDNQSPAVTGLAPLADGAGRVVNIGTDNGSPSVLGWRILTADGRNAAGGNNGYFNPSASTYAAAVDSVNGGVLPGMAGKHVAVLDGGAAGNYFLNTTRANAAGDTAYTLTVAIGVRDNPATFGGVRLDILADGQVVATASYTKTALDGLKGSDAAGGFTEVSLVYETGASVAASQPLAIRIAKAGGAGTVLDFDNVRFTAADSGYSQFLSHYFGSSSDPRGGSSLDPDGDGLSNRVEYFLGLDPMVANSAPRMTIVSEAEGRIARYVVPLDPAITEPGFELQYSFDLQSWLPVASSGDDAVISTRTGSSWTVEIALGTHPRAFLRMVAP
ncbi:MAG: hypothetical protein JWO82_2943, partial [Akkermansiaceae bacterium]|nr:hypothetical protein [Akkermansiaceae bacterium]